MKTAYSAIEKTEPNKKHLNQVIGRVFQSGFPSVMIDEKLTWTNLISYISAEITKGVECWSKHDLPK